MIEQPFKNAAARSGALKTTTALTPVAKFGEVALINRIAPTQLPSSIFSARHRRFESYLQRSPG